MPEKRIQPPKTNREFNGKTYVLTKIDYHKQDIEDDIEWFKGRGIETQMLEEDGFWLLYTLQGE